MKLFSVYCFTVLVKQKKKEAFQRILLSNKQKLFQICFLVKKQERTVRYWEKRHFKITESHYSQNMVLQGLRKAYPIHLKMMSGLLVKMELLSPWGTELFISMASFRV